MHRDVARLAGEEFDVVVAGGGVYALTLAVELAARGLRPAILERRDFAGATSFNSLKTIHGGIRALQHGALGAMREFVRERRAFARCAPHLVRPLPFVIPTYRHPVRNRAAMAAFLAVYDRLAADRNDGVDPLRRLPPSRTVDRSECLRLSPAIDPAGVTGGAVWHDYQLHAPERFAMALLRSARNAAAANYAPVTAILHRNGTVTGVRAHDTLADLPFEVRARVVVNAAGPWAWDLLNRSGLASGPPPRFSLAMNVVVNRPPQPQAAGGLAAGRFLFMVPWNDCSIIGTSHDRHDEPPDALAVAGEQVDGFLRDIGMAFPRAEVTRGDIRLVHRGLLPAAVGDRPDRLLTRTLVRDHARDGIHGLLTVVGVRYTTARATASAVADRVARMLKAGAAPPRESGPLAGGDIADLAGFERTEVGRTGLPAELVRRLIGTYGTGYGAVLATAEAEPHLATPLGPGCPVLGAEIAWAVRDELAVHLSDALLRRTAAGTGGHPGREAVARAAAIMAAELSWPPARTADEVAAVEACYRID